MEQGWLSRYSPSPQEIADLLDAAERDLRQSQLAALDADWRLAIAHSAALFAATAALAAAGFRAAKEAYHYRVLQSLAYTIQAEPQMLYTLDLFRRKRNIGGYKRAGASTPEEAEAMVRLAAEVLQRVRQS
ncbi:MAG: HEPN domain-containing protein, partial [Armatimonadetes bacterium]|nr:HEPN domain-containing protein [Armatimonadota bacterium]